MCVRHWLSDEPWNRWDLRGSRVTVDAAVGGALKLVAEKDAADPQWFAGRAEAAYDAPQIARTEKPTVTEVPSRAVIEPKPEPHSLSLANADLAARAALLLRTDGWLSRLAEHSEEMRSRIIDALGEEV